MRALQFDGTDLRVVDHPEPRALPGQAVVEVRGAGLCGSDLTVMGRPASSHPFPLPMILGHELAGTVVEIGTGVDGVTVGDDVVGYGPRGCGSCRSCAVGEDNYCRRTRGFPPGLGADGALAERVAVDARALIAADGIDALQAAALTDAGLTALHVVRRAVAGRRVLADLTAVVIGVGGLGHVAVQLLRHLGVGRIVAVDVDADKLALARRLGATDALPNGDHLVDEVRDLTAGEGVDVVLDLVASDATLATSARMIATGGVISVVGVAAGRLPVGHHALPLGARVDLPFWGTRAELHDVLALARHGELTVHVTSFGLDQAIGAYELLGRGGVPGRAVVVPQLSSVEAGVEGGAA